MGWETYVYVQFVVRCLEQLRASLQFPAAVPLHPGWQSERCIASSCS